MSVSRFAFVSCVLLTVCAEVFALSLGPVQGRAWLGTRLAVQVPIQLNADEVNQDLCIQVIPSPSGEESAPLTLDHELVPAPQAQTKAVLLKSRQSVQDLVVQFGISVGCESVIRRQYTLLIDPPSTGIQPPETSAPVASVTSASPPARINPAATRPASVANAASKEQAGQSRSDTWVKKNDRPQEMPSPNPLQPASAPEAIHQNKPAPLPLWAGLATASNVDLNEVEVLLSLKIEAMSPSFAPADQTKREEFRQLWAATQTPLEVQVSNEKELSKLTTVLADKDEKIKSIQIQNQQLQTSLEDDSKSYFQFGLGVSSVLLILSWFLFISFLMKTPYWSRIKNIFKTEKNKNKSTAETQFPPDVMLQNSYEAGVPASEMNFDSIFTEEQIEKFRKDENNFHSDSKSAHFLSSTMNEPSRAVATEELFDLQQQVEFFISLGQAHQAVEVLKAHVIDNQECSPLVYLDLLKLQYDLELREDYEHTRQALNARFNAGTPAFEQYTYSRRSLERYPLALSRIQALWPSPAVLALLERTIFKQELQSEQATIFDLEAYRELLLLYGIARELNHPSDQPLSFNAVFSPTEEKLAPFEVSGFPEFTPTRLQPLNATFADDLNKNSNHPLTDIEARNLSSQFPDIFLDTLKDHLKEASVKSVIEKNKLQSSTNSISSVSNETESKKRVFSLEDTDDLKLDFSDLDSIDQGKTYKIKKPDRFSS